MYAPQPSEQTSNHTPGDLETRQNLPVPLLFVPVSTDEASKGKARAKNVVRAHVTRLRHARSTPSRKPLQGIGIWCAEVQTHATETRQSIGTETQWQIGDTPKPSTRKRKSPKSLPPSEDPEGASNDQNTGTNPSIPPLPLAKRTGASRQDPFWTYPVPRRPYLPAIFAHYIENIAVPIPDIDTSANPSFMRHQWFPLAMTAPAPMYAVLLHAASHFCAVNPTLANRVDLLHLKSRALSEINRALSNPDKESAVGDAVVGAVVKMAAYEAVFGSSGVCQAHLEGLAEMVRLRGGLGELGLGGMLERMVVWVDLNAAFLCGNQRVFGGEAMPTRVAIEEPDVAHFAGIQ